MAGEIASHFHRIVEFLPLWHIASALLVAVLIASLYRSYTNPLAKIPGPPLSAWTGIVEKYHYVRGHRHLYVHSLHEKYGSYIILDIILRSFVIFPNPESFQLTKIDPKGPLSVMLLVT